RGQQQTNGQRDERAGQVVVEGAGFLEDLGGVAGHRYIVAAIRAEVDRPFHHAQLLVFGADDITEPQAGGIDVDTLLFELRQLAVPQRARRAHLQLARVEPGDLPVPA